MENSSGPKSGEILITHRRRATAGALIAGIAHLVAATALVFIVPTSRTLIDLDPRADNSDRHRLYCGSAHDFTDDVIIFAAALLLLPGWLTLALVGSVISSSSLPREAFSVAMVVTSSAVFADYGRFLAVTKRRVLGLGIAVFYIVLAVILALMLIGLYGFMCSG